jgi:transposase
VSPTAGPEGVRAKRSRREQLREERRARRLQRYERVVELYRKKVPIQEIARRLGMHRETVSRFIRAGTFPERASRSYSRKTDSFLPHLRHRWEEGCHSAVQLLEELRLQGFDGSYELVRRRVARWRTAKPHGPSASKQAATPKTERKRLSSRRVAWLLVKSQDDLDHQEQAMAQALGEHCPALKSASDLSRQFAAIVRQRKAESLAGWLARAGEPDVPAELRTFAAGLKDDLSAVTAALTLPWSNGQVEGQVNRLKLIKRQMFGRAKFDLLRQRVLNHAA